jgi:hypothetical protein
MLDEFSDIWPMMPWSYTVEGATSVVGGGYRNLLLTVRGERRGLSMERDFIKSKPTTRIPEHRSADQKYRLKDFHTIFN